MKYELNYKNTTEKSLLFWIERFIVYKISTLSRRHIKDIDELSLFIKKIKKGTENIEELHSFIKQIRNLGAISLHIYFNPLHKLLLYIQEFGEHIETLENIDEEYIIDFLLETTADYSNATKKNYRVAIVNFFKYIDKQNTSNGSKHIFDMELQGISWVHKKTKRLPIFLDDKNLKKFFEGLQEYSKLPSKCIFRNTTMLYLILHTGLRSSEVLNLKIKDISRTSNFYILKVIGKGDKERKVLVDCKILEKYLDTIDKTNIDSLVFPNLKDEVITQAYLHRQVMYILDMVGIKTSKKGLTPLKAYFCN